MSKRMTLFYKYILFDYKTIFLMNPINFNKMNEIPEMNAI